MELTSTTPVTGAEPFATATAVALCVGPLEPFTALALMTRSWSVSLPAWDATLLPQHMPTPPNHPHVVAAPAPMVSGAAGGGITMGSEESAVLPLPNWPLLFVPQQASRPSTIAQTHEPPAVICVAPSGIQ